MLTARPARAGRPCHHTIIWLAVSVASLAPVAGAQTTRGGDDKLDFGAEGLTFPPPTVVYGHTPRTAQLLGEAYRRKEPLEWRRVRLVADLGQVALAAAAPYVVDAMGDPSPAVRAEAARAARMLENPPASLLAAVEKLINDADVAVRREAVLSAASLAAALGKDTTLIERGLVARELSVVAAALQGAWAPAHAKRIAAQVPLLPNSLHVDAAGALARLNASEQAPALLPLLAGDVPTRAATVRALGHLGNPAALSPATKLLDDPHPTARREAITAVGRLDSAAAQPLAVRLLKDPDLTVREAATVVLTPVRSTEALEGIAVQLPEDYAPLHSAARRALSQPADGAMRQAAVALAAKLLTHADPRRREDGSYVLGRLRSAEAFDAHLALLQWDGSPASKTDWALVAQAAESLGSIGDARAAGPLMDLVKASPQGLLKAPQGQIVTGHASANALVALGRLRHQPALGEAVRVISLDPLNDSVPGALRAASAFVIGVLGEAGAVPAGVDFIAIYGSSDETLETKFEGLKALGNLRVAPLAGRLEQISQEDLRPPLRWIAHWSYQRCANVTKPYVPVLDRREPAVTITDLSR